VFTAKDYNIPARGALDHKVLVLNGSYEAINICNVKRAIRLLVRGKALEVESNGFLLRSERMSLAAPDVIRLKRYIRIPYKEVAFCRKNVLLRDDGTCQYCGVELPIDELTVDHIIPLSRNGKDHWSNVVAACKGCNKRKGNYLTKEIGMHPLKHPGTPRSATFLHVARHHGRSRQVWRKYLFFED
jgi:5-methylcytosine-specific restriction endonuclease McrA